MLYNHQDLNVLKDEIEFVDTAVIPFAYGDMDENPKMHASDMEMMQMITVHLEKQFKGRLFITPAVVTVNGITAVAEHYSEQLRDYGFKKIIILSHNVPQIEGTHGIQLNHIPLEDMSADMKMSLIDDEVKDTMKQIIAVWNNKK